MMEGTLERGPKVSCRTFMDNLPDNKGKAYMRVDQLAECTFPPNQVPGELLMMTRCRELGEKSSKRNRTAIMAL